MNLFYPNENTKSYKPALIRLFVYIGFILLLIFRSSLGVPLIKWLNILCAGLGGFLIFGIIYVFVEIINVSEAKGKEKMKQAGSTAKTKPMDISKIIELLKNNDIIEISILANEKVLFIGTSSDYNHRAKEFFDKQYYIDDVIYTSAEELQNALYPYTTAGLLKVISIE